MGQSASFTPRTITLGAMRTGVKQSNSGWNSQCDRQVRMPPSLTIGHDRPRGQVYLVYLVCLVYFVCLVCLVRFVRPVGEPDKPDEPNKPESLADSFSILLMLQLVTHSTQ